MPRININKKIKKCHIHSERLSRYITSRECMTTQTKLVFIIGSFTEDQRKEIREMLEKNKSAKLLINPKYKYV